MLVVEKPKIKITLKYLKTRWDDDRIKNIKKSSFIIGFDKILLSKKLCPPSVTPYSILVDAILTDKHATMVKKRDKTAGASHLFVSQFCDVAAKEYNLVCKILKAKKITFVGDEKFLRKTKTLKIDKKIKIEYFQIK